MSLNLISAAVFADTVVGTATSTTVTLGFKPEAVIVENRTTSTMASAGNSGKTTVTAATGARTTSASAVGNLIITDTGFTVASAANDVLDYIALR